MAAVDDRLNAIDTLLSTWLVMVLKMVTPAERAKLIAELRDGHIMIRDPDDDPDILQARVLRMQEQANWLLDGIEKVIRSEESGGGDGAAKER